MPVASRLSGNPSSTDSQARSQILRYRNKGYLDSAQGRAKKFALSEEQKQEIKEAFDLFDSDKKKKLDYHEVKVALRALGFDETTKAHVGELMRDYDRQSTGFVEFEDFQELMTAKYGAETPENLSRKAFKMFDDRGDGLVDLKSLRKVARELGEKLSDDELSAMIEEFDSDRDGAINEEDFFKIMTESFL